MAMKLCQKCGKPMEHKGGNHRYCNTCKDTVRKERKRINTQKYYQKMALMKLNTKKCQNCGKLMEYKSGNHKYCAVCSEIFEKENSIRSSHNYYQRWKDGLPETIGTGWLSHRPKNDFNEEYDAVKREMKRLGLATT